MVLKNKTSILQIQTMRNYCTKFQKWIKPWNEKSISIQFIYSLKTHINGTKDTRHKDIITYIQTVWMSKAGSFCLLEKDNLIYFTCSYQMQTFPNDRQ